MRGWGWGIGAAGQAGACCTNAADERGEGVCFPWNSRACLSMLQRHNNKQKKCEVQLLGRNTQTHRGTRYGWPHKPRNLAARQLSASH